MTNSYRESFEFLSRQRRPLYFFEQVTEIFFSSKERARYTFLQAPFFRREQCYGSTLKKRKKERKNQRSRREDSSNFLLVKEKPRYIFLRLLFRRETVPVLRRVRFHSSKKKKRKKRKILAKSRGEPFEFLSVTENFLLVKGALTLIKAPPGISPPFWLPKEGGNSSGMIRKCGVGPRCRWTEEEY